jgi:hypothetical protein
MFDVIEREMMLQLEDRGFNGSKQDYYLVHHLKFFTVSTRLLYCSSSEVFNGTKHDYYLVHHLKFFTVVNTIIIWFII